MGEEQKVEGERGEATGDSGPSRLPPIPYRLQGMDIDAYCRDIEAHLCRRNAGHLVRISGPAFDLVRGWAQRGIPFKVAQQGIDRYIDRVNARGPRRRPARIEFCEADVLDAFDAWRRAVGIHRAESEVMPGAEDGGAGDGRRRGRPGRAAPAQPRVARHAPRPRHRQADVAADGRDPRGLGRRPRRVRARARRHAPGGAPGAGRGARRGSSPTSRRSTRG